jgi:type IX secretion system PorP/SprF family membrane protein
MKSGIRYILTIGLLLLLLNNSHAQDLHFSQYFNAPLLVNPANTGFNPDYDYRLGANYRNQWANIGYPYQTMSAWGDTKVLADKFENGWVGLGFSMLKDQAGSGSLTTNSATASVAYHQMLGYKSLLSGGFSLGYNNKRIDVTKLSFDDQWNGKFFDTEIPSNEPFANSSISYLDLQVGLNYAYFASDNMYINFGMSIMHLNNPKESFFDPSVSDNRVDRRYTAFVNANIKVQDIWILNPNIYVSKMAGAWETVLGMNANRDLGESGAQQLILGLYYRTNDALIPMFGYQVNNLRMTVNYDATISTLSSSNGTRGAYELSIIKTGVFPSGATKQIKCPSVRF